MKERDIEAYLVERIRALGGEVRKVQWPGRRNAPDRVVMLPTDVATRLPYTSRSPTIWVELKNPVTVAKFPNTAHERAQYREHRRMRRAGQHVEVIGTKEHVDFIFPLTGAGK